MKSFIIAFIILLHACYPLSVASQDLPVLLLLKKSEQVDTSGCNFVEQVTSIVYDEIIAGRVKLWDSQKKEIQITGKTLVQIEKASGVAFKDQETIFMYEIWDNTKREIVTKTIGFSFVQRSNTSEEVAFGYVDYTELNDLFLKTKISTNASGIYSSTYTSYVLSKNFVYNIVQFGGKPVRSSGESEDIKKSYIKNLRFNESLLGYYPSDKYVSYLVDQYTEGVDKKSTNSKLLVKKIEEYLLQNQEVFFNMGGDRIMSHIQKNKFKVTRIEVNEIWRKMDGQIVYDPKSLIIYVNDSSLNEMNTRAMQNFDFSVDGKNMIDFLKDKKYNMIITKVNSQVIQRKDSFLYYKALMSTEWNKVIQFVVNY